ncbi:glycine receptor subunit alpha-2-like [Ptychodera flava]|uniref:glycine receptor subunit alpha-2-like n=1 Tax=Ptychodera flava TaxID=63121 RepID=UPI00396A351B
MANQSTFTSIFSWQVFIQSLRQIRMSLTLTCYMNLSKFPFDQQDCGMKIMSYAHRTDKIMLHWLTGENEPVEIEPKVSLPQYAVTGSTVADGVEQYIPGNFSYLTVDFHLERLLGFYLLGAFIPSSGLVVVAWLSLWIDPVASPARVMLAISTLLALITQSNLLKSGLPKVAYITAIDIWLTVCQLLVYVILLEYGLVYVLYTTGGMTSNKRCTDRNLDKNMQMDITRCPASSKMTSFERAEPQTTLTNNPKRFMYTDGIMERAPESGMFQTQYGSRREKKISLTETSAYIGFGKRVDKVCKVTFLGIFIIFAIIYWKTYYF